jgi:hypothetical protein
VIRRHDCITAPTTRQWWREYRPVCKEGNPLGLSFVEYVAQRVFANFQTSYSETSAAPWYVAACAHKHPWGATCSDASVTT